MVLSNKKIIEGMKKGLIVIKPFNVENLSTSSYDISLGENFYTEKKVNDMSHLYNPYSESDVKKLWIGPHKAKTAEEVFKDINFNFDGIKKTDKIILLNPGETILSHTNEFIGGRKNITTMMKARSSLGRNFIEVCKCAGWGDVGYVNRWTMEITNNSLHNKIPLIVGNRVGQIVFFEVGDILDSDYTEKGKYQSLKDIEEIEKDWKPEMMLPKMYKDREIKK